MLRFTMPVPDPEYALQLPYDLLPSLTAAANGAPLPLAELHVAWEGSLMLACADAGQAAVAALPNLRMMLLIDCNILVDAGVQMPALLNFGLIHGSLSGPMYSNWLPTSLTGLCLSASGLQRLPCARLSSHTNLCRQASLLGLRLASL